MMDHYTWADVVMGAFAVIGLIAIVYIVHKYL